jgi:hypothetical protein
MPQASLPLGVAGALHDRVPEVLDGRKSPSSKIVALLARAADLVENAPFRTLTIPKYNALSAP